MISGARYSGVPHSVQVRPFTRFANPKSVTWERKTKSSDKGKLSKRRNKREITDILSVFLAKFKHMKEGDTDAQR